MGGRGGCRWPDYAQADARAPRRKWSSPDAGCARTRERGWRSFRVQSAGRRAARPGWPVAVPRPDRPGPAPGCAAAAGTGRRPAGRRQAAGDQRIRGGDVGAEIMCVEIRAIAERFLRIDHEQTTFLMGSSRGLMMLHLLPETCVARCASGPVSIEIGQDRIREPPALAVHGRRRESALANGPNGPNCLSRSRAATSAPARS